MHKDKPTDSIRKATVCRVGGIRRWPLAGNQAGPRRAACGTRFIKLSETISIRSELVDVRRPRAGVPITSKIRKVRFVREQKDDVGLLRFLPFDGNDFASNE